MSKEEEVKKNSETDSEKKTAKELQQEVAEKAKVVAEAANKVAEAAEEEAEAESGNVETSEASETSETEETSKEGSEAQKKSLFGKKEKKNPYKEKFEDMQDKYMRQLAEFENFRKRTDKEKSQMFDQGASSVLEKFLPVLDNFERGLASIPKEEVGSPFADGMNMIYKQFLKQIEDLGVTPIEAVGKEFDPNYHNAVMQIESEEYEEGIVAQELQKGYMYHDMVLRHSMVAVAK